MSMQSGTDSDFIPEDRFAQVTGIEPVEVSKGSAKASMKIEDGHRNSHGTAHGGKRRNSYRRC
ncbi:acyl-coenzyme A thioesterase PaaI-like protein [Methanomicrobium sp. W14]|nr:acyl-coenzyme A thioesterase PaaI-like protein [Methanomicrobium sp. W14]